MGAFSIVTKVEAAPKQRGRYLIYLNESDEAELSVHEDILLRYQLFKGKDIDASLLAEIAAEDGRYRAYAAAIYYLGFKPRTSKEIERYLTRKEFTPEVIAYTLDRLSRESLINDQEYAQLFASQRMRSALKGRLLIKQELQLRGIPKETAAEAARLLDNEAEIAAAKRAAEKKWRSIKGETFERKRKLMAFLMRRGFPGNAVKAAVSYVIEDQSDEDDGLWLDN